MFYFARVPVLLFLLFGLASLLAGLITVEQDPKALVFIAVGCVLLFIGLRWVWRILKVWFS